MNFYHFNIVKYQADTEYLNHVEDIIYRRLIDLYYLTEKPLTNDLSALANQIKMPGYEDEMVPVLEAFFVKEGDVFRHPSIHADIHPKED